jgi:hypothetical protein
VAWDETHNPEEHIISPYCKFGKAASLRPVLPRKVVEVNIQKCAQELVTTSSVSLSRINKMVSELHITSTA